MPLEVISAMPPELPIARPPWTKLGRRLESMCRKALFEFQMLEGVDTLALALSGGKDSLTLLYMLKAILGRGAANPKLIAIHVSGTFSCGPSISKQFLEPICDALEVPLILCSSDIAREKLECYSCSRERRKLLFEAAKKHGANTIAFGHHRDDSVLTLMMNLLHKGEFAANLPKVPMHDYGVTIVRPLIYVPEEDIIEFAAMYRFARIMCQCPVGQDSLRQQSKNLLKLIEDVYPNARGNLAQAGMVYGSKKALEK